MGREWHLQKLTECHFRVVQATSLHVCGLFLTFLSDLDWAPEVSQGKLGSVCLGQTLFFCMCWYSASPCPGCASSYPWGQILSPSGYFVALLAWEGAYQNVVIYGCEFVVQCMGSEHLCRKALNSAWQGCSLYQKNVYKLNIWEVNNRTFACTYLLFIFREMAPVFKAQHLHGVICKTQAKTWIFHIAVTWRKVQLELCICWKEVFFYCDS